MVGACATLLSGCTVGLPNGLSYLTDRSVNLQAQVAGSLPETGSYHFDYGTTSAYGSSTPVRSVNFSQTILDVGEPIGGLVANTTYHYRICPQDSQGENCGGDYTFTTRPAGGRSGIVFESTRDGNLEIYAMNANGSGQTRLTSNAAPDGQPAFSPDGKKIAFRSTRDGDNDIYVMNTDGSGVTQLTDSPGDDLGPAWEPGAFADRIAFFSNRDDGNYEIYRMNTDGSNQTRETFDSAVDSAPSYAPSGRPVTFAANRTGNFEVHRMMFPPLSQFPFAITNNPGVDNIPSWSPFGDRVSFHTNRDGNFEIYRIGPNGESPTRITNNASGDFNANWSPDGAKIAFESNRDGASDIFSMNVDGSGQVRLTPTAITFNDTNPKWSPRWP